MKVMYRTIAVMLMSMELVFTTGCVNPNGTQNNTGTGALIGGAIGALAGAAGGGRDAGQRALIGAAIGAVSGALIGNMIDQEQRQRLRQQSPQTWNKLQNNDAVYANSPPASTPPAVTPSTPAATAPQMQQFTVDDIKALTKAGVKPDAINKEIDISQSKFSQADIAAAQQANPPVAPEVIAYMQSHPS